METIRYLCYPFYVQCFNRGRESNHYIRNVCLYECGNTGCYDNQPCRWAYVLDGKGKLRRLVKQQRKGIPKHSVVTVYRNVN